MTNNCQKEIQTKLAKGLLDMIVLQLIDQQPMHGYQVITKIRKTFGIYFGPSTIYPLLANLEKKGYLKSEWNMDSEKPRKVFTITTAGQTMLKFTENSLGLICRTLQSVENTAKGAVEIRSVCNSKFVGAARQVA
ncbi:MAG: PadR family transcriptional regulator [Candidatus Bathyarchaeia archaeon]